MGPETLDGRSLGCSHERFTTAAQHVHDMLDNHPEYHPRPPQGTATAAKSGRTLAPIEPVERWYDPNRKVDVVSYIMERFARDYVVVFCELSGCSLDKIGTAPTPFLDESNDPLIVIEEPHSRESPPTQVGPTTRGGDSNASWVVRCSGLGQRHAIPNRVQSLGEDPVHCAIRPTRSLASGRRALHHDHQVDPTL